MSDPVYRSQQKVAFKFGILVMFRFLLCKLEGIHFIHTHICITFANAKRLGLFIVRQCYLSGVFVLMLLYAIIQRHLSLESVESIVLVR